jgi:hypothetical protein
VFLFPELLGELRRVAQAVLVVELALGWVVTGWPLMLSFWFR